MATSTKPENYTTLTDVTEGAGLSNPGSFSLISCASWDVAIPAEGLSNPRR